MNIKELAKKSGLDWHRGWTLDDNEPNRFSIFALLVAAQTRARCIELVLAGSSMPIQTRTLEILQRDRKRIAALIEEDGKS
jgi:hypothetical protein